MTMKSLLIQEIVPITKSRFKIICEGCSPFVLYKGELSKYRLKAGQELDENIYNEITDTILLKRAKSRAMYLLQKKDYTESQLRAKLQDGFYSDEIIDQVVEFLYGYHYLDDRRYAEQFLAIHGSEFTRSQIKTKLYQRGVTSELIDELLEDFDLTDEKILINKIIEKKRFDRSNADEKERNRMVRHLLSKGFSYNVIRDLIF